MATFDTFDRTGTVEFPFPAPVVFRALEEAVGGLKGMEIQDSNRLAGHISLKTGASAFSWGEKVTVSVLESGPARSRVQIASAAKTIAGSATTHGRNRKNVEHIIRATASVLEQHGELWAKDLGVAPSQGPPQSTADEIRKLADLHQAGVLTADEFAAQKQKLLGL